MKRITIKKAKKALENYQNSLKKIKTMDNYNAINHLRANNMEFGFCSYFDFTMGIPRHTTANFLQIHENNYICDTPMTYYRDDKDAIKPMQTRILYLKKIIKQHETITIKRTDY